MQIALNNTGKRFGNNWIIKGVNHQFATNQHTAIVGSNGSGKSTLLRLISAYYTPTNGSVIYTKHDKEIEVSEVYRYISYAAPYLDLTEQMTLSESIHYHNVFKPFVKGVNEERMVEILSMKEHVNKKVAGFSSGMKMRLKLALAILSDTPILLLDEPLSNLDQYGRAWYKELLTSHLDNRIVIVCSNREEEEYFFCKHIIDLNGL